MPQLGETVTEGTITKWLKNVGDRIEEDEVIYEVSTDKVDSEVPSPVAGYLTEIKVPEGETAEVGAVLAVVGDAPPGGGGDGGGEAAAPAPAEAPADAGGDARADGRLRRAVGRPRAGPDGRRRRRSGRGVVRFRVERRHPSPPRLRPRRPSRRRPRRRRPRRPHRRVATAAATSGDACCRPSSAASSAEHDLDVDQITGTGAGGRITRADVLAVIDDGAAAAKSGGDAPAAPAAAPSAPAAAPSPAAPAAPRRSRRPRLRRSSPASATRSSRSATSAAAPPSTWSAASTRPPTRSS